MRQRENAFSILLKGEMNGLSLENKSVSIELKATKNTGHWVSFLQNAINLKIKRLVQKMKSGRKRKILKFEVSFMNIPKKLDCLLTYILWYTYLHNRPNYLSTHAGIVVMVCFLFSFYL